VLERPHVRTTPGDGRDEPQNRQHHHRPRETRCTDRLQEHEDQRRAQRLRESALEADVDHRLGPRPNRVRHGQVQDLAPCPLGRVPQRRLRPFRDGGGTEAAAQANEQVHHDHAGRKHEERRTDAPAAERRPDRRRRDERQPLRRRIELSLKRGDRLAVA
jgi:hypothetical protein